MFIKKLKCCATIILVLLASQVGPATQANAGSFVLVSDIDDTIKITDVLSYWHAFINGLFHRETFLGMNELLNELARPAEKVVYLSGAPQSLATRAHSSLVTSQGFPEGIFVFSDWSKWESVQKFKASELNRIEKEYDQPFLFFGDDTQFDPEVFHQFQESFGEKRVVYSYIHRVKGRDLPSSVTPYSTAFEIALNEVEENRLSPWQALAIGNAILNANRPDLLFPFYVICPVNLSFNVGPRGAINRRLRALSAKMTRYVQSICLARQNN